MNDGNDQRFSLGSFITSIQVDACINRQGRETGQRGRSSGIYITMDAWKDEDIADAIQPEGVLVVHGVVQSDWFTCWTTS